MRAFFVRLFGEFYLLGENSVALEREYGSDFLNWRL